MNAVVKDRHVSGLRDLIEYDRGRAYLTAHAVRLIVKEIAPVDFNSSSDFFELKVLVDSLHLAITRLTSEGTLAYSRYMNGQSTVREAISRANKASQQYSDDVEEIAKQILTLSSQTATVSLKHRLIQTHATLIDIVEDN